MYLYYGTKKQIKINNIKTFYSIEACVLILLKGTKHNIKKWLGCLSRISGPMKHDVTAGWRKIHNELHSLCFSCSTIRVIKS
jgi:hypothetical protein